MNYLLIANTAYRQKGPVAMTDGKMTYSAFVEKSQATAPHTYESAISRLTEPEISYIIVDLLGDVIQKIELLDTLKKYIYYGKVTNESDRLILEFVTNIKAKRLFEPLQRLRHDEMLKRCKNPSFPKLLHGVLTGITEAGELCEAMLKTIKTGEVDVTNFSEEIHDINWGASEIFTALGVDPDQCLKAGIAKLQGADGKKGRYSNGFNEKEAINRDIQKEREILENFDSKEEKNGEILKRNDAPKSKKKSAKKNTQKSPKE
jgi:hypothetical protein